MKRKNLQNNFQFPIFSFQSNPKHFNFHTIITACSPLLSYKIFGQSMAPTLSEGQRVLVNRLSYFLHKPQEGDIIALRDPRDHKVLIKRIMQVKNERYFVQGDNTFHSTDSREFGMIEKRKIIGKVFFRHTHL